MKLNRKNIYQKKISEEEINNNVKNTLDTLNKLTGNLEAKLLNSSFENDVILKLINYSILINFFFLIILNKINYLKRISC